jgi:hypothetical protein
MSLTMTDERRDSTERSMLRRRPEASAKVQAPCLVAFWRRDGEGGRLLQRWVVAPLTYEASAQGGFNCVPGAARRTAKLP